MTFVDEPFVKYLPSNGYRVLAKVRVYNGSIGEIELGTRTTETPLEKERVNNHGRFSCIKCKVRKVEQGRNSTHEIRPQPSGL